MTASAGRPEGLAGRFGPGVISRQVAVRGAVLGGGVLSARAGADVHAFTLGPEQDEQFGGFWAGAAEPVRGAGVELGGLAGLHDEVKLGEAQPDAAGQHVHPLVALVGSQFGFALGGWEEHLVGAQPAGPLGQRDEGPAVAAYWLRPDTGVAWRRRAAGAAPASAGRPRPAQGPRAWIYCRFGKQICQSFGPRRIVGA